MLLSPSNIQYLTDADIDWDINEFFDLDNAAMESTTHGPASTEPFSHNGTPIEIPAQPALNGHLSALPKVSGAASGCESQDDAAQHTVMTIEGQPAIQFQFCQSDELSDSHISASVRMIHFPHAFTLILIANTSTHRLHSLPVCALRRLQECRQFLNALPPKLCSLDIIALTGELRRNSNKISRQLRRLVGR
jgi:hypothetical protein